MSPFTAIAIVSILAVWAPIQIFKMAQQKAERIHRRRVEIAHAFADGLRPTKGGRRSQIAVLYAILKQCKDGRAVLTQQNLDTPPAGCGVTVEYSAAQDQWIFEPYEETK